MSSEGHDADRRERILPKRRSALQWNLQTLLLLTAVVAVWAGYLRYGSEIPQLEQEIDAMKRMVRELVIEDPQKVAIVKLQELWMDDQRWDVYLPEGSYALRLATREVGEEGLAPVAAEVPIPAGQHRLELRREEDGDGWQIVALVDDQPAIEAAEEPGWYPGRGTEGSGAGSISTQQAADLPLEVQRFRFPKVRNDGTYKAPPEPTEGLLLWIERVEE